MQQLPVELHARIFVECLPSGPYVEPAEREAPLLLVRVCRLWREVAHRTPQLWCSLDAVQDLDAEGLDTVRPERMEFYRNWLSRSGNRPLSLGVSISEHPWLRDEWLEAVQCYRGRFERLRVVDGAGLDLNVLLDGSEMLKHLAIQARFEEGDRAVTILQPQPSLRTLVLDLLYVSPATFLQAGWTSLTRLAVRLPVGASYAADEFLHILDHCPRLERLVFGPVAVRNFRQPPRSHPNLRALSVIFDCSGRDGGGEAHGEPLSVLFLPGLLILQVLYELEGGLEGALASDTVGPFKLSCPADSNEHERSCAMQVEGANGGDRLFSMFDLCWTSITQLDVDVSGNTGAFGTVLTLCPNLQGLDLYGPDCSARCTSLPAPFTHRTLAFLSITSRPEFGNLLFMATLPGLCKLSIFAFSYGEPGDIRDFLIRSGCPLNVLKVKAKGSRVWTGEEKAELRELVPTLTDLVLDT